MQETIAKKTIYFLIDCSGSMQGNRADAVNIAMDKVMQEAIPAVRSQLNNNLELNFQFIGFSGAFPGGVAELMPPVKLEDINKWNHIPDSAFNGGTPTGAAINAVIADMDGSDLYRGDGVINKVADAIILISDGMPNGDNPTYEEVLLRADKGRPDSSNNFRRALRVAIGISVDEDGRKSLEKFGKISASLQQKGLSAYYDCSEDYVDNFVELLKSMTVNLSVV